MPVLRLRCNAFDDTSLQGQACHGCGVDTSTRALPTVGRETLVALGAPLDFAFIDGGHASEP